MSKKQIPIKEFGRTLYLQGKLIATDYGRDHHPRNSCMWMACGGVQGGISLGGTDDLSCQVVQAPVQPNALRDRAKVTSDISAGPFGQALRETSVTAPCDGDAPSVRLVPIQRTCAAKPKLVAARFLNSMTLHCMGINHTRFTHPAQVLDMWRTGVEEAGVVKTILR